MGSLLPQLCIISVLTVLVQRMTRGSHTFSQLLQDQVVTMGLKHFPQQSGRSLTVGFAFLLLSPFARDLEARAQNEFFRAFFRLPRQEKLHTVVDCSLWTPFSRCHTAGRMFASDSYICFASKDNGCCNVILPLREVAGHWHGFRGQPQGKHGLTWIIACLAVAFLLLLSQPGIHRHDE